ncbi:putative zinc-binding metallopeptidase [Chitinophaga tropicalis]|uniref:Lipoprotein n=1 Tax=Chitinophaga tropicalis TaxID=2683588 RepID=A0A7K1U7S6_9BACT|nr:hypothetical protein [Chitinophaga tropicalis]MVT10346.1 hypothetical protein [Chitinophaga tropicalis]
MKQLIYILVFTAVLFSACKKEEALTPSESLAYTLPQGNHSYDTLIMDYYNKYGTYMLYKFTDRDAYWTPSGWKNAAYDSVTRNWSSGFLVQQSGEQYVAKQLDVIGRLWFRFYSDKFLQEFLPAKVLLCSSVDSVYLGFDFTTTPVTFLKKDKEVYAWYSYDNISVSFGNMNVENISALDSAAFIWKTSKIFMEQIFARKSVSPVVEFTRITSYTTAFASQATAYTNGSISTYWSATQQNDWNAYMLAMVTCSETMLKTAEANTISSFKGILNSTKDTNGRIRQRYNIVRNYFINNYNVDLQAIGNAAIPR